MAKEKRRKVKKFSSQPNNKTQRREAKTSGRDRKEVNFQAGF